MTSRQGEVRGTPGGEVEVRGTPPPRPPHHHGGVSRDDRALLPQARRADSHDVRLEVEEEGLGYLMEGLGGVEQVHRQPGGAGEPPQSSHSADASVGNKQSKGVLDQRIISKANTRVGDSFQAA